MYFKQRVKEFNEYHVDTNGIVYSKKGFPLKYSISPRGYAIVNFTIAGKSVSRSIHSLVAKQFLPPPTSDQTQVNHKDGDKLNNRLDNLEWVTPQQNVDHARYILGHDNVGVKNHHSIPVCAYDPATGKMQLAFDSLADAGRYFTPDGKNFRCYQNSIHRAAKGERKTYRGLAWEYGCKST